jgi:membrane protease subunit (stomatin/prohibitin family)
MVQQAKLDDKALQIAQETIQKSAHPAIPQTFGQGETKFCTKCGAKIPATAKFCPECGEAV